MARLGSTFKADEHDTTQREGFDDLPAGILQFEIEASDVVETGEESNRTGKGLKYTANVLAPEEVKGRKFFGFINLENKNAQAEEIGKKEFASLCRAVGVSEVDDSEDLHFLSYTVKLGMGKPSKKTNPDGTPKFAARMEIKKYFFPTDDQGNAIDLPEPEIDADQPAAAPKKPANDNRKPAAAAAPVRTATPASGGERPKWGAKK